MWIKWMNTPTSGVTSPVKDTTLLDMEITFNWYNMKLSTEQLARDGTNLGYNNPAKAGELVTGTLGTAVVKQLHAYVMWLNPHVSLESTQDPLKDALAKTVTWDGIYLPVEFISKMKST
jgi:hypothetical protein